MGRWAWELQVKRNAQKQAKPYKSTTPIVTRLTRSSHSWIRGRYTAANTTAAPCSLVHPFVLIVSIRRSFSTVVTSIIAPSYPLHSQIGRVNVSNVSSLAKQWSNAVAPSIFISWVGLSLPLPIGFPSRSTGIAEIEFHSVYSHQCLAAGR